MFAPTGFASGCCTRKLHRDVRALMNKVRMSIPPKVTLAGHSGTSTVSRIPVNFDDHKKLYNCNHPFPFANIGQLIAERFS